MTTPGVWSPTVLNVHKRNNKPSLCISGKGKDKYQTDSFSHPRDIRAHQLDIVNALQVGIGSNAKNQWQFSVQGTRQPWQPACSGTRPVALSSLD